MLFDKFFALCEEIKSLDGDADALRKYNASKESSPAYHLHEHLGPCPFEGDIINAPVVLLLANPCSNDVVSADHKPTRDILSDWPLWGLHPNANKRLRAWWKPRLDTLIEQFGLQKISQSVAAIQLNPWASQKFDASNRGILPSRQLMLDTAEATAKRGALLVVVRSVRLWCASEVIAQHTNKIINPHPICSYVSKGNLGECSFSAIELAIKNYLDDGNTQKNSHWLNETCFDRSVH